MVVLGIAIERMVLRPLVNQPQITLFMATIGLTFVLEGLSQIVWGSQPHGLELGIPDVPMQWLSDKTGINVSQFDLFAAAVAGVLVAVLAVFFQTTRIGRALRAVADDHQAALAVGIPLRQIWAIVWTVAGFVALVAGLMWGARNGVQYALTFIALKALPVLILGGFESVAGAIVGGLIIGASEKLAEVYLGPYRRRRPRILVPVRAGARVPAGAARGPVRRKADRAGLGDPAMLYREAGQFKTTYAGDQQVFPIRQDRIGVAVVLVVAFVVVPLIGNQYWLSAILTPFLIFALATLGLNILTGYAGQLSLGTAAFMAVGAFMALQLRAARCRGCRSSCRSRWPASARPRWASRSACRRCASRASTSPWRRSPASSSCCGRCSGSAGSRTTARRA